MFRIDALWLATADFGDPRERRVLRKSNGDYTYLAGDLAMLRTAVDATEDRFTERQRVAIRLTDALVTQPSSIDDALVRQVHEHFDAAKVVEIVLDVARNAANKIAVAFSADAPNVTEGVEYFDLDGAGEVIANVDAEVVRAGTAATR